MEITNRGSKNVELYPAGREITRNARSRFAAKARLCSPIAHWHLPILTRFVFVVFMAMPEDNASKRKSANMPGAFRSPPMTFASSDVTR
jgi:hypothetical protein